jgi:hypothetical protein
MLERRVWLARNRMLSVQDKGKLANAGRTLLRKATHFISSNSFRASPNNA